MTAFDLADQLNDLSIKTAFMGTAVHALMTDGSGWSDKVCYGGSLIFRDLEQQLDQLSDAVRQLEVEQ